MSATRKDIARALDTAAARADMVDAEPATSKQCWFLAGLLAESGRDAQAVECGCTQTHSVLTKTRASREIEWLLAEKAERAQAAA